MRSAATRQRGINVTGENDAQLIARVGEGDQFALGELLLSHAPQLTAYLTPKLPSTLRSTVTVDDILQQTFIRAFRGIGQLEPLTPEAIQAWLKKIADHQLQDILKAHYRKKRGGHRQRVSRIGGPQDSSMMDLIELLSGCDRTASQVAARQEAIHAIQIGIAALPEDQRQAVRLHLIDGQSLAETAKAMHRTPGAVSALVHRAKQSLGEMMGRASTWLSTK
jgi:RNA polymerase sigma-70 factor (ECF subfamily)